MNASYQFIATETANYPVVDLCRMLGVSRSGYYGWASRSESSDDLAPQVSAVFWRRSRRYGSREKTMATGQERKRLLSNTRVHQSETISYCISSSERSEELEGLNHQQS